MTSTDSTSKASHATYAGAREHFQRDAGILTFRGKERMVSYAILS
jgi:hypothetical protein